MLLHRYMQKLYQFHHILIYGGIGIMMIIVVLEKVMHLKICCCEKISMNMIRATKQLPKYSKKSFKIMRKLAGWDNDCLNDILNAKFI